jgi:hypothetical protein
MQSNITLAAFIQSLLSQPFTAADIQDGDCYKNHSRGKKNDVEHYAPLSRLSDCVRDPLKPSITASQNRRIASIANMMPARSMRTRTLTSGRVKINSLNNRC